MAGQTHFYSASISAIILFWLLDTFLLSHDHDHDHDHDIEEEHEHHHNKDAEPQLQDGIELGVPKFDGANGAVANGTPKSGMVQVKTKKGFIAYIKGKWL